MLRLTILLAAVCLLAAPVLGQSSTGRHRQAPVEAQPERLHLDATRRLHEAWNEAHVEVADLVEGVTKGHASAVLAASTAMPVTTAMARGMTPWDVAKLQSVGSIEISPNTATLSAR